MLVHIGQPEIAESIQNSWLRTIEDGVHTYHIYKEGSSKQKVGTKEFAEEVVARLGRKPQRLKPAGYSKAPKQTREQTLKQRAPSRKELIGVDVFLDWKDRNPVEFGRKLEAFNGNGLKLLLLSNRGRNVYPNGFEGTFCTDHWRARFKSEQDDSKISRGEIADLLKRLGDANLDFIKTENLYTFDGEQGFSD
jgi:isocitrate dehydrogenase